MQATVVNAARRSFSYSTGASPSAWRPPADRLWEVLGRALDGLGSTGVASLREADRPGPHVVVLLVRDDGFSLPRDPRHPWGLLCDREGEDPQELFRADELRSRYGLTRREVEVVRLLADRLPTREIARRLGISLNTARRHSESILRKLAVRSRHDIRDSLLAGKTGLPPRSDEGRSR